MRAAARARAEEAAQVVTAEVVTVEVARVAEDPAEEAEATLAPSG